MKRHRLLVSVVAATLMVVGVVDYTDAGLRGRGEARGSINRAPAGNVQRPNRPAAAHNAAPHNNLQQRNAQRGNLQNAPRGGQVNAGNRVNASNRQGNRNRINTGQQNINIDNHRDVDIDVDGHGRWGYDDHYHPIATAAAVTATVAVTSAVVGSILRPTQMPSNCVQVIRVDVTYMQCGSTWYQPQYQGSDITYVVVNAP